MVSHLKRNSAEWFIEQINVENAKLLAFVLVIGFIGYHGLLHLMYGPDSCTWLLMSGRYKGDHEWQPYGCMLHIYSKTDSRRCLRYLAFWGKYNSFAFIGDSRIEQLYNYFIGLLKTRTDADAYSTVGRHNPNYTYIDTKLRLSVSFVFSNDVSRTMVDQFKSWQESDKPPSVIVAGTGLQLIRSRNATDPALDEYKRNLTHLVQAIDSLASRHTQVLWKLVESVDMSKMKQQIVSNVDIDAYNAAAVEILTHSAAKIWNSPRLIVSGAYSDDGVSLSQTALRHSAQVVLNMFCNEQMNFYDGSCCAAAEACSPHQLLGAAAAALCAVLAITKALIRWTNSVQNEMNGYSVINQVNVTNEPSVLTALAKLGVIIAYFYLCDRTNFFMKENKYYSEWSFWLPVGYVFALGLFFTEESRSSRVLHREQTDEWKGWMQLVFLISQVTGASKVLPIYMMVRILISSYLFLSGYGNVYYTWRTSDCSVVRFGRVMFRLNFVTFLLCLAMNRPYQFYGFVPLVSFGYTLMFILLSIPPQISSNSPHSHSNSLHTLSLVVKILILLTILTVLYMSEVFFQKIFVLKPWKALFVNADDDIRQWWLRWKQDRYSMAAGIIFALAYLLGKRHNLVDDNNHNNLFSSVISITATLLAFIGIGSYITYTFFCTNTYDCNEIHSYVAFIPIISYILLRNVSGALRMRHSSMFAWFGNITLELYISHSHIWLAADTHGILVLIPGAPGLNLILTSYIFVCAAHEVHKLTMVILPHAVPNDWKLVLRNFTIFCAVMVPLSIRDGIF